MRIGTQARGIEYGLSLLLEKGPDRHGSAAKVQGEVSKCFDNLPLNCMCIWLLGDVVDFVFVEPALLVSRLLHA